MHLFFIQKSLSPLQLSNVQIFVLKGLCHEMNILFKVYKNKKVLSVHALIVLTIFCCL
jgi:hypothetical protein